MSKAKRNFINKKVGEYQEKLGMKDYEIAVFLDEELDGRGEARFQVKNRLASILVDKETIKNTPLKELERIVFHEMCEILLGDIHCALATEYADGKVELLTHQVIRRLENLVFGSEGVPRA